MVQEEEKTLKQPLINKESNSEHIQNQDSQSDKIRVLDLDPDSRHRSGQHYRDNRVRTSKYTAITFLPLNLMTQFSKMANIYFIVIMFMQMVDVISISDGQPAMLPPLIFVIVLSMIKDAYEDYCRHVADDSENKDKALVYDNQARSFVQRYWHQIRVGDIIQVNENQFFPADMLLIHSSGVDGICYVETKNLDGETNLKHKNAPSELNPFFDSPQKFNTFSSGKLVCEQPNNQIYKFDGNMELPEICIESGKNPRIPVSNDNVLLRGMSLRNTEVVYGLVVYTGSDTKIQQNTHAAKYKHSKLMRTTNNQIFTIFACQIMLAAIGSVWGTTWMINNLDLRYLDFRTEEKWNSNWWLLFIKTTGTWVLVFTNFVPISLLVTLELVKFWQASFMEYEWMMYDQNQDMKMKAQSSNLNEELGQVEYIFSDKTGTLTCNIMEFQKFSAGMFKYSLIDGEARDSNLAQSAISVNMQDEEILRSSSKLDRIEEETEVERSAQSSDPISRIASNPIHPEYAAVSEVLMHLALCHTVIIDPRSGKYNASSPDELALVEGAKELGFEFISLDTDSIMTIKVPHSDSPLKYELLNILEFNSTRKRMSVIVKDLQTNKITLLTKGADSVIEQLLERPAVPADKALVDKTMSHIDDFAQTGLRTLILAKRDLSDRDYNEWNEQWVRASEAVIDRDTKLEAINGEIEHELRIVGSTAIEDKLQDEVSETLKALKQVGIKVWVLTGDKVETAINIGYSCGLMDDYMDQYVIQEKTDDEIMAQLDNIKMELEANQASMVKKALVLAGDSLLCIEGSTAMRIKLLNITDVCDVVLACRVSPKQKADIVEMVRGRYPKKTTLAIGDGANDVSMIMKAHVGVGIAGREGMQAARSSDFAIGQFKFLKPLLFIHGRECYRRNADLVCYTFYKNVLFVIPQYFYGFYSVFSGQTLYEPWIYQLYNITFTGLPIMLYALMDFEYTKEDILKNPMLYRLGMEDQRFGTRKFWQWVAYGVYQGFIVLWFTLIIIQQPAASIDENGKIFGFWASGHQLYGTVVVLANLVLLKMFNHFIGWSELFLFLQATAYFWILYLETLDPFFTVVYRFYAEYVSNPACWFGSLMCIIWIYTIERMVYSGYGYYTAKKIGAEFNILTQRIEQATQVSRAKEVQMSTLTSPDEKNTLISKSKTLARRSTMRQAGFSFAEEGGSSLYVKRSKGSWPANLAGVKHKDNISENSLSDQASMEDDYNTR